MKLAFGVSTTIDEQTGEIISVYFQVRRGKVAQTCEFADGAATADYDKNGYLLGVEILAPCSVRVADQLAANESSKVRADVKRFIRKAGPRHMIAA